MERLDQPPKNVCLNLLAPPPGISTISRKPPKGGKVGKSPALLDVKTDHIANGSSQHDQGELGSERAELLALRAQLQCVEREMWENKVRRADLTARLKDRDQWINKVRSSPVWKVLKPLWKLQGHFSKSRQNSSRESGWSQLVFAVDSVDDSTRAQNVLNLTGWCLSHGGPEIVGVRARVDGKSYFARYGLKRDEIAPEVLDYPAAAHSGFSVTVPAGAAESVISLEAITQGGRWQRFFLRSPPTSTESSAWNIENYEDGTVSLYPSTEIKDIIGVLQPLIEQHTDRSTSAMPLLSVITTLSIANSRWITEAGASLFRQTLPDWEWCLLFSPALDSKMRNLLEQLAATHNRFRLLPYLGNSPSEAINDALEKSAGTAVCFLDEQDLLHPEALATVAETLREGYDIIYSDEDKFDEQTGKLKEAFFKPDWSPEYLRGVMYVGHLLTIRRDLARRVRFNSTYDGIHRFEFMLRATETGARIGHIPKALYHSRKTTEPTKSVPENKRSFKVGLLQQRAVNAQLQRLGLCARAEMAPIPCRLKMVPTRRTTYPKISVIIPTKDSPELLSRCLGSLYHNTAYPTFETILADNETSNPEAIAVMRDYPVTRVHLPNPFNFSRANNLAIKHATGEYLVFLNNDTEIVTARWLDHLLYYAEQPDVGAVGALLLHDNGAVQHAGVVLGMRGTGDHAMRGFSSKSDGYLGSLSCAREVSAVTAACMMMRKELFEELDGFNEHFSTMYQDLDLGLRLRERGLRIIWTPQALLLHHESISRSKYYDKSDRSLLLERWRQTIERGDPYYNRNLDLKRGDYGRS